ncbi:cytidine deaminase [Vreelandella subglaciescola]|jgi:cytidine deaminase|uniref:Cytidine deaminase n=1 Tax=Vreelandella subglaciescola TaxID=29571 RepID=A0A1M7IA47_9GAMM|nr:cytidine deaminase [Halomonas subglaciescola]SHM37453.1 cytidine deaminase [Halomonas subglaciescola]
MTAPNAQLVAQLASASENAYAPYSRHPVAAVAESEDGARFAGANVEVAHYKGLCAEASALAAMVTAGQRHLTAVYVMGPGEHLCTPCGDCRQRIREFATPDTRIHVLSRQGAVLKSYRMEALLPDAFGPENLPAS